MAQIAFWVVRSRGRIVSRVFLSSLLLIAATVLTGCASVGTKIEYSTLEKIGGNIDIAKINIHAVQDGFSWGHDIVSLEKFGSIFFIDVDYYGREWRFMDGSAKIEIDEVITDLSATPLRSNGSGYVSEVLSFTVSPELLHALVGAKKIRIQYWGDPITIDENGMKAIQLFVSTLLPSGS